MIPDSCSALNEFCKKKHVAKPSDDCSIQFAKAPSERPGKKSENSALLRNPNHDGLDLMNYHRLNFFFSQFASMPFGHSSAILALGLSTLYFYVQGFQSENRSVNLFDTVPTIAVVQAHDHRPQQPQTSPAALRKDHIEKSSRSVSTSVNGFWFC